MDDAEQTPFSESDDPRYAFLRGWLENEENQKKLMTAFRPMVGHVARMQHMPASDAVRDLFGDVTKAVLSGLYRKYDLANYPKPDLWLLKIAHTLLRRLKSKATDEAWRLHPISEFQNPDQGSSLDDVLDRIAGLHGEHPADAVIAKIATEELLSHLNAVDREIIEMCEIEDLPFAEIGLKLGINEGTARVRHHRALGRLRAHAEDYANDYV